MYIHYPIYRIYFFTLILYGIVVIMSKLPSEAHAEAKQFKLIYFSSIVKQVLTTYLNHSWVPFLEPTSNGVIIMKNHGCDPCGIRTHKPKADTLSTRPPLPLGS